MSTQSCKNDNSLVLRGIFAFENCENANSLILWACFGASGNLRVLLARKIRNVTLKTKAPVDYSLRMERLLFRLGWVRASGSLWEPFGASGKLREILTRKIGNMTLKTEAPVDYILRMERRLFRLGWVEGLWKLLGAFGSLWQQSRAPGPF